MTDFNFVTWLSKIYQNKTVFYHFSDWLHKIQGFLINLRYACRESIIVT